MIATCSEWLLAICFELYILTFAIEFRNASCHAPKLKLNLDTLYQNHQFNFDTVDKSSLTHIERSSMNDHPISISIPTVIENSMNDSCCNGDNTTADSMKLPVNFYILNNSRL